MHRCATDVVAPATRGEDLTARSIKRNQLRRRHPRPRPQLRSNAILDPTKSLTLIMLWLCSATSCGQVLKPEWKVLRLRPSSMTLSGG